MYDAFWIFEKLRGLSILVVDAVTDVLHTRKQFVSYGHYETLSKEVIRSYEQPLTILHYFS